MSDVGTRAMQREHPIREGDEMLLEITDLAFGGRGVGGGGGFVVFVDGALPGESVRARIVRLKRGFAEADCLEVARPSPERVAPRCRHYGPWGGCDLQHLEPG